MRDKVPQSTTDSVTCNRDKSIMLEMLITEPLFYEPHLLPVKSLESCILSIQFYARPKFCVINTIAPPWLTQCRRHLRTGQFSSIQFSYFISQFK